MSFKNLLFYFTIASKSEKILFVRITYSWVKFFRLVPEIKNVSKNG